jgi:hypothetical protein
MLVHIHTYMHACMYTYTEQPHAADQKCIARPAKNSFNASYTYMYTYIHTYKPAYTDPTLRGLARNALQDLLEIRLMNPRKEKTARTRRTNPNQSQLNLSPSGTTARQARPAQMVCVYVCMCVYVCVLMN